MTQHGVCIELTVAERLAVLDFLGASLAPYVDQPQVSGTATVGRLCSYFSRNTGEAVTLSISEGLSLLQSLSRACPQLARECGFDVKAAAIECANDQCQILESAYTKLLQEFGCVVPIK